MVQLYSGNSIQFAFDCIMSTKRIYVLMFKLTERDNGQVVNGIYEYEHIIPSPLSTDKGAYWLIQCSFCCCTVL